MKEGLRSCIQWRRAAQEISHKENVMRYKTRLHESEEGAVSPALACRTAGHGAPPTFGGGVKPGEVDREMPIRTSALLGQLRFRRRLLYGVDRRPSKRRCSMASRCAISASEARYVWRSAPSLREVHAQQIAAFAQPAPGGPLGARSDHARDDRAEGGGAQHGATSASSTVYQSVTRENRRNRSEFPSIAVHGGRDGVE